MHIKSRSFIRRKLIIILILDYEKKNWEVSKRKKEIRGEKNLLKKRKQNESLWRFLSKICAMVHDFLKCSSISNDRSTCHVHLSRAHIFICICLWSVWFVLICTFANFALLQIRINYLFEITNAGNSAWKLRS